MTLQQQRRIDSSCWNAALLFAALVVVADIGSDYGVSAFSVSTQTRNGGRRRRTMTTLHCSAAAEKNAVFGVALTREDGKNEKMLQKLLDSKVSDRIDTVCLPCIGHAPGPDTDKLPSALTQQSWDWVAVTSPEAARVLAKAWDYSQTRSVCAVGKATCDTLQELKIQVDFVPSKATAKTLVKELPVVDGSNPTVLYPASAQAAKTLQDGLQARGCKVTRLNTYDTVTATWTNKDRETAAQVQIACFASPSAVAGWLTNTADNKQVLAACIGETSATACRQHGWSEDDIYYPEKPGLAGWVSVVAEAVQALQTQHAKV